MEVKKVLLVTGTMNVGGAETLVMNFLRSNDPRKCQNDLLYFTADRCFFDSEIEGLGSKIFRIGIKSRLGAPLNNVIRFFETYNLLKRNKYDVVHVHTQFSSGIILWAAKLARVPLRIAHAHMTLDCKGQHFKRRIYHSIARALIRTGSNRWVACGITAGSYLFGNKFHNKGIILENSIDTKRFNKDKSECRRLVRHEFSIEKNIPIIAQIGRLQPVKNHVFTIELAKWLKQRGVKFKLIIVGDGPLRSQISNLVIERGLLDDVVFAGHREDIDIIVNGVDLIIMPSKAEGLPLTLVEAQVAGTPCLVSDNIPREASKIPGLLKFLPLDYSYEQWYEQIKILLSNSTNVRQSEPRELLKELDMAIGINNWYRLYGCE